jgi:prolyl oligopeptidase
MRRVAVSCALLAAVVSCAGVPSRSPAAGARSAPQAKPARVEPVVESRFGVRLEDPYRWMEKNAVERDAWMREQGELASLALANLPWRPLYLQRGEALARSTSQLGKTLRVADVLLYKERAPGAASYVLRVRTKDGQARTLMDPSTFAEGHAHASIDNFAASPDGRYVAVNVATGGGEVCRVRVVEVATGQLLPDTLGPVWGEIPVAWLPDASGFLYTQMAPAAERAQGDPITNMRTLSHRLGEPSDNDVPLVSRAWTPHLTASSSDAPFPLRGIESPWGALTFTGARSERRIFVARASDLHGVQTQWKHVAEVSDEVSDVQIYQDHIYLLSARGAPNRRLLRGTVADPRVEKATAFIEEGKWPLVDFAIAKDGLYLTYLIDGVYRVERFDHQGRRLGDLALPPASSVTNLLALPSREGAVLELEEWVRPEVYVEFTPKDGLSAPLLRAVSAVDPTRYVVERDEATSRDGTRVPLTIIRRADTPRDGARPTVLGGYGAYGISLMPGFLGQRLPWLELGGVYAFAHVRGGGEKGEAWHRAGQGRNKPAGIDDFIACAERLVQQKLTSPFRLAARGGSAGGILVGRALVQRPDLFAAVALDVGMLNALRYLEGENGTNQTTELAATPDNEDGFRSLLAMDVYHGTTPGVAYPAVIVPVGLNDGRVPVWNSAKFVARMQRATTSGKPVFLRIETDGGHGIGGTSLQEITRSADVYAFFLDAMKYPLPQ